MTRGDRIRRAKKLVIENRGAWRLRYEAGEYLRDIAQEVGVTEQTVSRAITAAGGTVRPRGFGSNPERLRGAGNPAWKGGRAVREGYWIVWVSPDDPYFCMARSKGYALEHRLVMAREIGRPLLDSETVHHIDGNGLNNDRSNLQLRSGQHGTGIHLQCGDCGSRNVTAVKL